MKYRTLLIEDDADIAGSLKKELQAEGYEVAVAARGDEGLAQAKELPLDLVITDLRMPGLTGLELVTELHCAKPQLPIILMTAFGTSETAIEATRLGAYDYLLKPFDMTELLGLAAKAVNCSQPACKTLELSCTEALNSGIVGTSRAMRKLYKEIGLAAASPLTALIRGETGTGKELVARAVHNHSARAQQPFIAVNCTAIPETLLESELFGHERGAYTGAQGRRLGRFEQADRGTIFLDEIGDLTIATQAKLLRVLQEKYIQRLGSGDKIPVDARIVAATHRDLESAMQQGQFREDLFYRLTPLAIWLPPLRERLEDIPDLVKYFLQRTHTELGVEVRSIQLDALDFLKRQTWPGNVRELENVVRHAQLLAQSYSISLAHVEEACGVTRRPVKSEPEGLSARISDLLSKAERGDACNARAQIITEVERELFTEALRRAKGNLTKAAHWLGITRTTMRERLTAFGFHLARGRSDPAGDEAQLDFLANTRPREPRLERGE